MIITYANDAEYQALREAHVGASEVAAVCGVSPWATRFEIWHRKRDKTAQPDNERMFWGRILEGAIAEGVRQQHGLHGLEKATKYYQDEQVPVLGASLDYFYIDADWRAPCVLEIKTTSRESFYRDWTDGPPLYYQLQVQAQLACTGWLGGMIAVLVGGNALEMYTIDRHEGAITRIRSEVYAFWKSIENNEPPAPDWEADSKMIADLYRHADASKALDIVPGAEADRLSVLCAAYKDAATAKSAAMRKQDAAKAEILSILQDASRAVSPEWEISAPTVAEAVIPATVRQSYRRMYVKERRFKGAGAKAIDVNETPALAGGESE